MDESPGPKQSQRLMDSLTRFNSSKKHQKTYKKEKSDGQISVRLQNLAHGKEPLQLPHQQER